MAVHPRNARDLFLEAIEDHPLEKRWEFVSRVCGDNIELREQVEWLLRAYDPETSFMQTPAAESLTATHQNEFQTESLGSIAGRYTLLEKLGEGGMGSVYLASQEQPVERNVALKVIKAGMDSREVVIRFEAERQALALMDHPNISKVLDGGVTESGLPYFVMELVKGCPITEFCDTRQLPLAERLKILITVCDAVQHAHQKGIIHRDLKPANILVEIQEMKPVPKVIDFGVAKALGQQLTKHTLHTGFHEMVGTPQYMSPEQAGAAGLDVDTRSDVYSLGVILYELLTGQTPFDRESLRKASYEEIRRTIREVEPPRPSGRVSSLENSVRSTISRQRCEAQERLSSTLRGELDWITMKAMEKDRSRRYQSPNALAADLQRYLSNEPVLACPPSTTYRLRKAVSKHQLLLGIVLCVLASLVLGTTVSVWQAAEARSARRLAEDHFKSANEEKIRFRELAWKTGIREAYSSWEQYRYSEVDESLDRLQRSDRLAEQKPEWQLLRQELNVSFRQLLQIDAPLHEVRIIPHSNSVVAVGGDGNIYVVDFLSCQTIRTIPTGVASLHALAVSDDGRLLATGGVTDPGSDRAIPLVFDLQTGERVHELPGQLTTIESLEFSADARYLACGARYENVQIIEVETGMVFEIPAAKRNRWLARSSDGKKLAMDSTVIGDDGANENAIREAGFSPPSLGELSFVNLNDCIGALWIPLLNNFGSINLGTANLQLRINRANTIICYLAGVKDADCFALGSDSVQIFAGLNSGEIAMWNIAAILHEQGTDGTNSVVGNPASHAAEIPQIEMSRRWQVSSSSITSLAVSDGWILTTTYAGELLASARPGNVFSTESDRSVSVRPTAAWSQDGHVLVLGQADGSVYRGSFPSPPPTNLPQDGTATGGKEPIDEVMPTTRLNPGQWPRLSPPDPCFVAAIAISPDQQSVAWIRHQKGIYLVTRGGERLLKRCDTVAGPVNHNTNGVMEFSPDSRHLAWAENRELWIVDFEAPVAKEQCFKLPGLPSSLAWSSDGLTIMLAGNFGTLVEVDLHSETLRTPADTGMYTRAILFSQDDQQVICGHENGMLRLWSRRDDSVRSIHLHQSPIRGLALSHDGRIGASAAEDGSLALWTVETGERIGLLKSTLDSTDDLLLFPRVVFTQDDTQFRFLFESSDHQIHLQTWDLKPSVPE